MSLDKFIELSDGVLESENSNNKLVRGYVAAFKLKHFQKVFQALKEAKELLAKEFVCKEPGCCEWTAHPLGEFWLKKYDKEFSK